MQFRDIPGNDKEKEILLRTYHSGNTPHALMFTGPTGNAKLALALAFAQFLNCKNPGEDDSCGTCDNCHMASGYVHPDIHFSFPTIPKKSGDKPISTDFYEPWRSALKENPYPDYYYWIEKISKDNKQGNITREECRSIMNRLSLKAFCGKSKIMIIWLPEYLGSNGNSLLKILEEPPKDTYFFLVCDDLDTILPTILSRTRIIKTSPFSENDIRGYLEKEDVLDVGMLNQIIFMANGDMNRARQLMLNTGDDFSTLFREWMLMCYRRDMAASIEWCNTQAGFPRDVMQNFLKNGLYILRECLLIMKIEDYQTKVPVSQVEFVKKFSKILDSEAIEALYLKINDAIYHTERNVNAKIMLFELSLKIQDIFESAKKRLEINI